MSFSIILIQDKLLTDMDHLVESGRIPAKNVEAAKALLSDFIAWIESQPEDYIPASVCTNHAAMEDFCQKAQAGFHAQRKAH